MNPKFASATVVYLRFGQPTTSLSDRETQLQGTGQILNDVTELLNHAPTYEGTVDLTL